MKRYIYQIEKFLRGQMSQNEENSFRKLLRADIQLRILSFMVTNILREQKTW